MEKFIQRWSYLRSASLFPVNTLFGTQKTQVMEKENIREKSRAKKYLHYFVSPVSCVVTT